MRIALIGYGKMGNEIEQIAITHGHTIALKITSENADQLNTTNHNDVDVAIEFTTPQSAYDNVAKILKTGIPVVCGTTGWQDRLEDAKQIALQNNTALLWSSNFSIGVNIFFELNKTLARLMNSIKTYNVKIEETHHIEKKDAPSGTAITLAEQVISNLERKKKWAKGLGNTTDELSIMSHRVDTIPGTHIVHYFSDIDDIEIKHTAHNRKGFALGAVLAAEFISDKKGIYSMNDVLGL